MLRKLMFLALCLLPFSSVFASAPIAETMVNSRTGTAYGAAWNPDGTVLAIASGYEITLFSADLKTILATSTDFMEDAGALDVTWNGDGTQLAVVAGYNNPKVSIWNWEGDKLEMTTTLDGFLNVEHRLRTRQHYAVSWHENSLVTLTEDRQATFQVWDMETREVTARWELDYAMPLREIFWHKDEIYGAGQKVDGIYVIFNVNIETGETAEVAALEGEPYVMTLSPDGRFIAVGYADGKVIITDVNETVMALAAVEEPTSLSWHGDKLAVLGYGAELQIWDVSN